MPIVDFYLANAPPEVPGSIPGSGNHGAHFYCGTSSDNLFWTAIKLKYTSGMKNPEWETFYVNRSSGPCGVQKSSNTQCKTKRGFFSLFDEI